MPVAFSIKPPIFWAAPCDMGVSVQRKACGVVPQHTGQGFHIYPALHGHGGEGMTEVVKPHAGINIRSFQEQLVDTGHPAGTPVVSRLGRREQDWVVGMLLMLLDQKLHRQESSEATLLMSA